jgi:SWI/SNF-related matrix-associated actin-dependent regulator of chromatin subfamily A-like protein 1
MQLYPYQQEGAAFLAQSARAYLGDEMGLGKSVQAAAAAGMSGVRSALVVAPASTLANWDREWKQWAGGSRMHAVSYDRLARYPGDYHAADYDLVILDEAHYCRNPMAKRTRAALDIARKVEQAWLLSGTPIPKDVSELWSIVRVLWPHIPAELGIMTGQQWLNFFCRYKVTPFGRKVFGLKNADVLRAHLKTFMLRRTVEQVAPFLPPLRVDVDLLPQDDAFTDAIAALEQDAAAVMAAVESHSNSDAPGALPRLRRLLGEAKAPRILQILQAELDSGAVQKIVVLAYHHSVLDILRDGLWKYGVVGFDGGTPQVKRQSAIDAFTNDPRARVFLAQQTAAGVGINLQAAHEVVLVEPAWTPDDNAQAIKRVHRIGQTTPCRARIFAVADSLDEAVMNVCARRTRMQAEIL